MVGDPMRSVLTPRLALLTTAHFTVDAYASFFSPLLPLLATRLHLNLAMVGTLVALASLSSAFSQPLFGLVADRVRRPWLIGFGPLVAAVFMSAVGLAPSYAALVAILTVGGLGVSWFHPQSAVLATQASARRSPAMSVFITGGTLGGSLGPLISVVVVGRVGIERSWVVMFPGLLLAAVLIVALARLHGTGREPGGAGTVYGAGVPPLHTLKPVLRPLALLYIAVVARSAVSYGFMTFLPIHLHRLGHSVTFGGTALTAYLSMGALGGLLGGWLAERFGGRHVIVLSFLGAIPFFLAFLALPTVPGLVCLAIGSFIVQGSLPVNIVLGQELEPRHSSTISSLLMGAAWGVGALLVAPIGVLGDAFGIVVALAVLTGFLLLGLVCALALPSPRDQARLAESTHA
jgi:FSR family fosmidomycin resistance protein-like MFS transporter